MIATIFGKVGILVRVVVSLAVTTWLVSFPLLAVAVVFEYTGVPYPGGEVFLGAYFATAFLLALKIDGPFWPSEAERLVKGGDFSEDRCGYEGSADYAATLLDADSGGVRLRAALALCHADSAATARFAELDHIGAAASASGPGVLADDHDRALTVFLSLFGGDTDAPLSVTPADFARDVLRHYEGVEDRRAEPYPAAGRLDKLDEAVASAREHERCRGRATGGGFEEGLDDYACENCGATLYDVMDLGGTADGYVCGY